MQRSILQSSIQKIIETTLSNIFSPTKHTKSTQQTAVSLIAGIFATGSTLLHSIAQFLNPGFNAAELKQKQENISYWLQKNDYFTPIRDWLMSGLNKSEDNIFAFDFSDISKCFGGRGMEGMAFGYDGSSKSISMGHDFIAVASVNPHRREGRPVYIDIAQGRKSQTDLLDKAIEEIWKNTCKTGWFVMDRGMDSIDLITKLYENNQKSIIRIQHSRDFFGLNKPFEETLATHDFIETKLQKYTGIIPAKIRYRKGHILSGKSLYIPVLIVESRIGDIDDTERKSGYFMTICPNVDELSSEELNKLAILTAQTYLNRWEIETMFRGIKQDFGLESLRVRSFTRLKNLFALCFLAFQISREYIMSSSENKRIIKTIKDNIGKVAIHPTLLLHNLRALLDSVKLRYITGRPKATHKSLSEDFLEQMTLPI